MIATRIFERLVRNIEGHAVLALVWRLIPAAHRAELRVAWERIIREEIDNVFTVCPECRRTLRKIQCPDCLAFCRIGHDSTCSRNDEDPHNYNVCDSCDS